MARGCSKGFLRGIGFIVLLGVCVVLSMIWPQLGNWIEAGAIWPYRADSYQISYYCDGGDLLLDWASITWLNGDQETEIGDYGMPFRVTYKMHYGDNVKITARAGGSFRLHCGIDIDGIRWKTVESSGGSQTIECSGIVGHKE